ncbi:MAG: hypothetical protein ACRDEA_12045 [Microcystaceae cyanobacterium]
MPNEEIQQLIVSNAKAIEALTNALAQERKERQKNYEEWDKDRNRLYRYMGRIASAQAGFYEIQGDYYQRLAEVEERQSRMQEQINQQHSQIIEILNRITSQDN